LPFLILDIPGAPEFPFETSGSKMMFRQPRLSTRYVLAA